MLRDRDYNIANAFAEISVHLADATGVVSLKGKRWQKLTFAELATLADNYARVLHARGVRKGQRVMLMVPPSADFMSLTFALFRLGAVIILIDPGMGYKNLLRCIASVQPDTLIGVPRAIVFSCVFRKTFVTLKRRLQLGGLQFFPWMQPVINPDNLKSDASFFPAYQAKEHDLAAIVFTTGSTGPPKGVQYTHGIFHTQLKYIRDYFGIGPGDVDQPGFPLFGLFSTALGATAVIPDMDPTRPAEVKPQRFVDSIQAFQVTYSFGSPAIWNVVSRYCLENNIQLSVKKVLMAGAPVPGDLIERMHQILPEDGKVFTPYGATESLPIACIEGREITEKTWPQTRTGKGTCVGRPLPGISIRIIEPVDTPIPTWDTAKELKDMEIGEIVVKGPVVTREYDHCDAENRMSKIADGKSFWHRIGDMGYLDLKGRLWFCGRKAHRVLAAHKILYTIPCEAIFNEHPKVFRSALVGVGEPGEQVPVLIVEPTEKIADQTALFSELRSLGRANPLTTEIDIFLVHYHFPVDIRHNAKIFREQLALWASQQLERSSC
ncbi:MAG: peptide synthase [Desulfobulbus propionicus]|nr:MAG: peptide synthase [Desulfobulbus propionicus]